MPSYVLWSPETIDRLRALWDEGLPTAEIGRRLGTSKNSVVGKAHRLDLPQRPTPIKYTKGTPKRPTPRAGPRTLAPLPSLTKEVAAPKPKPPPVKAATQPPPQATPAPPKPFPATPYGRVVKCCWPLGDPGTLGFRFCEAPSTPGKPYCQEHAAVAYIRVRDRREGEAA